MRLRLQRPHNPSQLNGQLDCGRRSITDQSLNRDYFCKERKGERFNHLGYFLYWSPLRPSPTAYNWLGMSSRWYCSEIVIGALKHGEILDDSVSNSMHPNDLYKLVQPTSMADCGRDMDNVNLRFV